MDQPNWNVVIAVATSVLWITGPSERAAIKARLLKAFRPRLTLAKYRAGITEGRRLGKAIRATDFYWREPHLWSGSKDPADHWLPKGTEYDPLYWRAYRRALTPLVDAALEQALDRRMREFAEAFKTIERNTSWTYQPKGHNG